MSDVLRDFYNSINREEAMLSAQIATDRLGLLMRIAINELDLDFDGAYRENLPDHVDHERAYLMRLGVIRIIQLALQAHPKFEAPTLTFQRDERRSLFVLSIIGMAGAIEHGRRVAQSIGMRLGRIERLDDRFRIVLPSKLIDLELHERELHRHYVDQYRESFAKRFASSVDSLIGDEVKSLLTKLVYPFRTNFIGYDADPTLDAYFFGPAYSEIELAKGFDTFHYSTLFGGITFQKYKLAATFIVFVGMKHRAFVEALLNKEPTIRIEDVLTVSAETGIFLEGLREFVNQIGQRIDGHVEATDEEVRTVFDVLSISRNNLSLLERPGAPVPPLIQCSDEHVITPLAGAVADEVMLFLMTSLHQRFPQDYAKAQRTREGAMQRAIERLLRSVMPNLTFRGNIKLRRRGAILTDLDLVILEEATDRVVLVQLKHQDPYGADLAAMQSRIGRLNQQVSKWLLRVNSWLADASESELRATLQLPSSMMRPTVSMLILTRHFAHSLRTVVDGSDAAFANWDQLAAAVERIEQSASQVPTIDSLLVDLKAFSMPIEEQHLPEPPSDWRVGDLRFTIEQEVSA